MCEYRTIAKNNTAEPTVLSVCPTMWEAVTGKQEGTTQINLTFVPTVNKRQNKKTESLNTQRYTIFEDI